MATDNSNKGGRPRKTDGAKKTHTYRIRFTEEEFAELCRKREEGGYASVASLVHHRLFNRQKGTDGALPIMQIQIISGAIREINAVGKNINQAVKKLESMDSGAEKAALYEAKKIEEYVREVIKREDEILENLNRSTAQYGYPPMKGF